MTQDWTEFLACQALAASGRDFGNLHDELAAARAASVFAPLADTGLIRASGADAADFLQNLLTNDVKGLRGNQARLAGLCTAKGRLLALFVVWRDGEDFMLALPRDILAPVLKKLSMYVLRAKVRLADASSEFALLGLSVAAPTALPGGLEGLASLDRFGVMEIAGGRAIALGGSRWLMALAPETARGLWPGLAASACAVGTEAWHWLAIRDAQPQVVAATQEAYVPQMLNLELPAVAGVSFTKGCYPGQEIVARTQYLGKVKRRTFRAHLASDTQPGTPVYSAETGDQHCGSIVSAAAAPDGGVDCLVCVQIGAMESGDVRVATPAGERLAFLDMPYPVKDDAPPAA